MEDASSLEADRAYQELALKGYWLRVMPVPNFDLSQTGSLLISNAAANYQLDIQSLRDDPVKIAKDIISGAPFLDVFLALGREPPRSLLSMFVKNPVGKKPGQEALPYGFSLSADLGLLIVHSAYKERDAGNPREELFSEIMFRVWYEEVRGSVGNPDTLDAHSLRKLGHLKYIIHEDVENTRTQKAIDRVAELLPEKIRQVRGDEKIGTQPGFLLILKAVSDNIVEQEAFNAILGSENGRGVAYLLNQHSHVLGGKTVVQIRIFFYGTGGDNPCVLFRIGVLRLPKENWKPSQLPYDPAFSRPGSHFDSLRLGSSAQDRRKKQSNGDNKTEQSSWMPTSLGDGTGKILTQPVGSKHNNVSTEKKDQFDSRVGTRFRKFHKRADTDSKTGPDTTSSSGFSGNGAYQLAATLGKNFLKILNKPDTSTSGSTIIMKAENNYKLELGGAVPLDPRGVTNYLIAKYLSAEVLRDLKLHSPRIVDRISVNNIWSGGLEPGKRIYDFEASHALRVLVLRDINLLNDMGSPIESSISEIFYRIWFGVTERAQEDPNLTPFEKAESMRKLRGVIIENPKDTNTISVIDAVTSIFADVKAGETGSRRLQINDIPDSEEAMQIDFTARTINLKQWTDGREDPRITKAFRALVGCESGKAVARMLQDHSEALGMRRIEEVRLFSSVGLDGTQSHHLLYKIGSFPPGDPEDFEQSPANDHLQYEDHVKIGENMRTNPKLMRARDVSRAGSDIIMNPDNGYKVQHQSKSYAIRPDKTPFLPYYILTGKTPSIKGETNIASEDTESIGFAYDIAHSRSDGLLVIEMAFKSEDRAYPKEQRFSEILYRVWYDEVNRKPVDPRGRLTDLKYIGADSIINRGFTAVARYIFKRHRAFVKAQRIGTDKNSRVLEYLIFEESSKNPKLQDSFDALLATVFGRAISRMLYDHSNGLGGKRITQATVLRFEDDHDAYSGSEDGSGDEIPYPPPNDMPNFHILFKVEAPQTGSRRSGGGKSGSKKSSGGKAISRRDIGKPAGGLGTVRGAIYGGLGGLLARDATCTRRQ
ncbi:uncharacterized protein DFL_008352 [Arthrobotrys flagrans]|uniref:Uncharacterized protein n=1 Tax=Arthrobotrys flagrans TaxID=97331 RepID=A0A436ZNL5_ARTFL|nr:hypothetical protein DFL_008352 [Arthrobotrys flagrans]